MIPQRSPAIRRVSGSAYSFDMLLGRISPKVSTNKVMTMVDSVGPKLLPNKVVKTTVAMAVAAMFTMLFPIRIAERALSN